MLMNLFTICCVLYTSPDPMRSKPAHTRYRPAYHRDNDWPARLSEKSQLYSAISYVLLIQLLKLFFSFSFPFSSPVRLTSFHSSSPFRSLSLSVCLSTMTLLLLLPSCSLLSISIYCQSASSLYFYHCYFALLSMSLSTAISH